MRLLNDGDQIALILSQEEAAGLIEACAWLALLSGAQPELTPTAAMSGILADLWDGLSAAAEAVDTHVG